MRWIRAIGPALWEAFLRPVKAANAGLGPLTSLITVAADWGRRTRVEESRCGVSSSFLLERCYFAFVALVERVVRDSNAVTVPDDHRNYIKNIAQSYRGAGLGGIRDPRK